MLHAFKILNDLHWKMAYMVIPSFSVLEKYRIQKMKELESLMADIYIHPISE